MLVEMIAKRKRFFAAQRAEQIRNKLPTRAQLKNKMVTYLKHMDSEVVKDSRKGKAEGSRKKTVARKRTGEKLNDKSAKRQKIEDDDEKEELRAYLDIIPGDDEAINVESLATKYPIVDWKTHALSKDKMKDVLDLYRLVKERFETASPEGYDILLWRDLITVFEPSEDDDIWKAQQDYTLISWRLFDSCGVHVLLMDTGTAIHMLIEKTYPLTQEMLSRMLSRRLEVDHECEMAYELLSKKRIEKLQHDGLLKSTDEESFDKYVSCLSGKMTRKPFPHRTERATDLLGIIHTDVCGPLRHVSRQGASYFITFTDDYSRYGYIYLLKHKHEVFETFKVFKNEVENQLGKTIKALRSDRGGEYISQEFKDYLKACGIV
ncbi:retrotransposon protein, putative, ty1-copia subclass [Tanacetum coccineum]